MSKPYLHRQHKLLTLLSRGLVGCAGLSLLLNAVGCAKSQSATHQTPTPGPTPAPTPSAPPVCRATIPNSNRDAANPCLGWQGTACDYTCIAGYIPVGSHVCQTSIPQPEAGAGVTWSFSGGSCRRLCTATASPCPNGQVPTRWLSVDPTGNCYTTVCRAPDDTLRHLARSNWELWRIGRNPKTGMYLDHVRVTPPIYQAWHQAGTGMTGLGLVFECVAEALGWQTRAEAQERVLLTLRSLTGQTPGFSLPRNPDGWIPTFVDSNTGAYSGDRWALMSTGLNAMGYLFVKTYFSRVDQGSAATASITQMAEQLFNAVQWDKLLCEGGVLNAQGIGVPMTVDNTRGCYVIQYPAADGYYDYNEEHYTVWLAYVKACRGQPRGQCSNQYIQRMWRKWQDRRLHPNKQYGNHKLLSLWSSYVVQLPFYLVHPFISDQAFNQLFASHWAADWEYYNDSYMGRRGMYGLGAGPQKQSCNGKLYEADKIDAFRLAGGGCRMYSPYSVAGYMPVAPDVIKSQILQLLADGETVLPVHDTSYQILWRKSVVDPDWKQGYGVTLVDFSSELFGLSTIWLGADFYVQNTNHFPDTPVRLI